MLVSATRVALKDISPISIVWLRFSTGIIILGIAVALRKQFACQTKANGNISRCSVFWESHL